MANETDNIEFTRLFNDYILSNKIPTVTSNSEENPVGSINYGKDNPNNIDPAINKITVTYPNTGSGNLKLVKTALANITYGWSIANNGLFRQYIYEYEIKRHPDIDFKTIALQITGTENMARLIYDKTLLHGLLNNTQHKFNEEYDVSKNGWLMALANPNKWFKEFIEHNEGSFTYETEISGNISQTTQTNILKPVWIFNDGVGGTNSYTQLTTVNEIIDNWNSNDFYQTSNDSVKYIKEHKPGDTKYKLISEKDGSIGFIYDSSIENPSVNYYKPTYHIIGVGPLINKTSNILDGKDFNDYWCNNKLVLYMYMYGEQIIELKNIITKHNGNTPDIELVELYKSNETGMVSSLNAQTQLTNKINNHHEIVDTGDITWSEKSYTSTGATFTNLNICTDDTDDDGNVEKDFKKNVESGSGTTKTYAPESSKYINNLSVVYNKPYGSNPGNHIFGPETVYRIDYDSIKNKTIKASDAESDYQITFGENTTNSDQQGTQTLAALPTKSFKHKFGKLASSQIIAGANDAKKFNEIAKADDNKVYIISRLSLLPINNMEFYEGHNKLYVNVGWYNKMYNLLKDIGKNVDSYITPTFTNANYIPLEIFPVYNWTAKNYYWELNYSGNTILTFNEGEGINLTQKDPIDIELASIKEDKRSEYEYYFRNFIKEGHIKIDNYSQEILLLNSIFTDAMIYNYNCPLKCDLTDKELSLIYETKEVTYTYKKTPYCIYPQGTIANNMDVTGLLSQNISALLYRNSFHRYSNGTYAPTTANGRNASYGSLPGQSNYNNSAAIVKNQFNKYGQSFRTVNNDLLPTNPTPQEQENALATSIDYGTINTKDKYITYFKLRA